ncbi:MAG: EamA family transporter RarD [Tepidisphaeraceae bacterium]
MNAHDDHARHARAGLAYGLFAYGWWGLVPIYFKAVAHVPPLVVLAHRVVWSVVFLAAIVALQHRWGELRAVVRSRRLMLTLVASTIAVALNWLIFIDAVSDGRVLEASLGYFINPLLTVALAIVFLKERLRPMQAVALAIAAAGVVVLTVRTGQMPWVALLLALTFGTYGLLRKVAPVGPLVGLTVETTLLLPMGLVFAIVQLAHDVGDRAVMWRSYPLLLLAGVVTAVPLLSFAAAARRLRLTTLGFLQYVGPTLQLLLALWYGESFTATHAVSFGAIWLALVVFTIDSVRAYQARSIAPAEPVTRAAEIATAPLPE